MDVTPLEKLRRILTDANARETARFQAVRELLPAGLLEACDRYATAVTKPLTGSELDLWPGDAEGAQAVVTVLNLHPAFSEGSVPPVAEDVFGEQGYDPAEFDTRREVANFIVVGVSALVFEDILDAERARALVLVAVGADALSRLVRDLVLGGRRRGLDFDLNNLFSDRLIDPDTLEEGACAQGIQGAVLGLAISGGRPGRAWAKGIRRLTPAAGCRGDKVVIRGTKFGSQQPAGVVVMFPGEGGGTCVPAAVTKWTDTAVTVKVPSGVGVGCVGFAEAGTPLDVEAASTFAGVLEQCLGPAAFNIAEKIRRLGGVVPATSCPGCLPGRANYFEGGAPAIDFFTANFGHDVVVEPNQDVVLRWSARNAASLSLTRITQQGPFMPLPVPLPRSHTLNLGAFGGTQPAAAAYALTASNGCGSVRREVTVQFRRIPKLKIDAIEVVQAIQRPDNSVRLVAQKRTVARVFVDSGLTDGFDFGAGPNIVPQIVGNVVAYPVARGFGTAGSPLPGVASQAVPAASRSRTNAAHSLNVELPLSELFGDVRLEAQVAVAGHENDVGGPYKATASTTVTFSWQPAQYVVPMLRGHAEWDRGAESRRLQRLAAGSPQALPARRTELDRPALDADRPGCSRPVRKLVQPRVDDRLGAAPRGHPDDVADWPIGARGRRPHGDRAEQPHVRHQRRRTDAASPDRAPCPTLQGRAHRHLRPRVRTRLRVRPRTLPGATRNARQRWLPGSPTRHRCAAAR